MTESLGEEKRAETEMVVRTLNRLTERGYDTKWIADYLSRKTGKKVDPRNVTIEDLTLPNGNRIGWRVHHWMVVT